MRVYRPYRARGGAAHRNPDPPIELMSVPAHPQTVVATDAPTVEQTCFHCGLPVPRGASYGVEVDGARRTMCCKGCEAVAQAIVDSGLSDFYRYRSAHPASGREVVPQLLRETRVYDNPAVQSSFVRIEGEQVREASLILEGIVCAACVWLNERHLESLPGVLGVQVNYSTHRARIKWDERRIRLSEILEAVTRIGYRAHPYDPQRQQQLMERERRAHLRRLGLAGVLGMQVMMIAVALYAGAFSGMEANFRALFHWVSLLLVIPVVAYSARPFLQGAWRDIRHGRTGMDVPVSLGILIAFAGSAWATASGEGDVYYDSVVMFVFFLLTARYFELVARKRAAETTERLVRLTPAIATRLLTEGGGSREEPVPVAELAPGDRVLVRPGETVPADGFVRDGRSTADESLLTGESLPVAKQAGSAVVGGSVNVESPLILQVEKTGQDTVLSAILRLLDRAQSEKPRITELADRAAAYFVGAVLLLALGVALFWWQTASVSWLPITVAVLVVTCPCALSLATPAAVTAATGRLTAGGLLPTRGHALESLARASHVIFDKTGTLTEGRMDLQEVVLFADSDEEACLQAAGALAAHSEHPIARAIREGLPGPLKLQAQNVLNEPGAGLRGEIDGHRYVLGSQHLVQEVSGAAVSPELVARAGGPGRTVVLLARDDRVLAAFALEDAIRVDASELVQDLRNSGKTVMLLTGDQEGAARRVAQAVGIERIRWGLRPEDKLAAVRALQAQGATVAMVGDGVNDAPVLAGAQVSIAMGAGAQVAAASADMVLLSDRLSTLHAGLVTARKTLRIIRQNLGWAVAYNLIALPAAAAGWVAPWMAAIGMSASSLLVVLNSLRLARRPVKNAGSPAARYE